MFMRELFIEKGGVWMKASSFLLTRATSLSHAYKLSTFTGAGVFRRLDVQGGGGIGKERESFFFSSPSLELRFDFPSHFVGDTSKV